MTTMERTQHLSVAAAQAMLRELFDQHGLTDWRIEFNNAKRTAGTCNHRRRVITLSRYLLAQRPAEESAMTISHEVAHALVGAGHGHDYVWARKHRELGGDGKRCFVHVDESAPYQAKCPHQGYTRYRRPQANQYYRGPCGCFIEFERVR